MIHEISERKKNYPIDIFPSLQQNKFDRWTDFNEVEVLFKTRYIYKIYSMYKLYIYIGLGASLR